MTRETFLDACAAVNAEATLSMRACGDGRSWPQLEVQLGGRRRAWHRPTYRQAMAEAIDWLHEETR